MTLQRIHTDAAPAAIGPYSQAIVSEGWVFCSGQIPIDPDTMEVIDGDVAAQTELVMRNLAKVLEAAGARLDTVVKTTIFLADMADFQVVNEVYGRHFGDHRPARATVAVRELPKSVSVEVECIARVA